jgi:hypothetical protein
MHEWSIERIFERQDEMTARADKLRAVALDLRIQAQELEAEAARLELFAREQLFDWVGGEPG